MQYWLENKAPNAADTNNTCYNLSEAGARPCPSLRTSTPSVRSSPCISVSLFLRLPPPYIRTCTSVSSDLSLRLCLCLHVTQSASLFYQPLYLSVYLVLVHPSIHRSVLQSILFHLCISLPTSVFMSLCLIIRYNISLSITCSVCTSVSPSLGLCFLPSVCLCVASFLYYSVLLPSTRPSWRSEISSERLSDDGRGLPGPGTLPVFKLIFRGRSPRVSQHPSIATRRRVCVISK